VKQVLFLSGKGGTGKTSLAAAFAFLAKDKVLADCDVDAANLHLLLDPEIISSGEFYGSKVAVRDASLCTECGRCREVCRFDAIHDGFEIDPYFCEGCGACVTVCAAGALVLEERLSGRWFNAETRHGPLASAELRAGEEASGKLVSEVKKNMRGLAEESAARWAIIDGSPGIGCPVIASASGVDAVILVAEPTLAGMHDLRRVLEVTEHFRIPAYLVVNKADLSPLTTKELVRFAAERELPFLGSIPYDPAVPDRLLEGRSVVEDQESPAGEAMRRIFERFMEEVGRGF
jgi:MinD superfamily P-loop ATPase